MEKENMETKESEIEILGQRLSYPKTIYGAIFSIGLFVLFGFALYTILVLAKSENLGIITEDIVIGGFGGSSDFKRSNIVQHQFWTPSEKTKNYGNLSPWVKKASINATQLNNEFGEKLTSNENVFGYRRFEVYGKGRSNAKEGTWWVLNASPEFTTDKLAKIYQEFWGTHQSIYIETYNHRSELK
jgi:hypothetical protein